MQATGVLMTPSLVYSDKRWVPIRCVNFSDEPIKLFRGSTLGILRPATDGTPLRDVKVVEQESRNRPGDSQERRGREPVEKGNRWTREELYKAMNINDSQVFMMEEEKHRLNEVLGNTDPASPTINMTLE